MSIGCWHRCVAQRVGRGKLQKHDETAGSLSPSQHSGSIIPVTPALTNAETVSALPAKTLRNSDAEEVITQTNCVEANSEGAVHLNSRRFLTSADDATESEIPAKNLSSFSHYRRFVVEMAGFFKAAPAQIAKMPVRNPILQTEVEDEPFKPSRMRVTSYKCSGRADLVSTTQEKPRGMAKGTFSLKNMGSLSLAEAPPAEYHPPRREPLRPTPPPRKAAGRTPPPARNPITQEDVPLEVQRTRSSTTLNWRPSETTETLGNKRYLMPSEQNPGKTRYSTCRKSRESDIFGREEQPPAKTKPRLTLEKPSQAAGLLQYKFAPEFRNDGVSPKPETQLLSAQDYQDFRVHRNQAELYRIRASQSTLTF